MSIIACSVDECGKPIHCKQLCNKHYLRMRKHGDPLYRLKPEGKQVCTIQGCEKYVSGNGLCGTHYMRNRRTGSPTGSTRKTGECKVRDCSRRFYGRDMCQLHYLRERAGLPETLPSDIIDGKRHCTSCQANLDLNKFATDRRRKDGLSIYCLKCATAKASSWASENTEKARQSKKLWESNNPDKRLAMVHRRRSWKWASFVEDVDRTVLMERDSWVCGICGDPIDRMAKFPAPLSPSIDHIIPLSRGGSHGYENTQAAHLSCNTRKGARVSA